MEQSPAPAGRDVYVFFALALAITWLLDLPWVLACWRHTAAPPYALPLTGLGAFGPTLAAVAVAAYRRQLRGAFGRWRTSPVWILIALALPYPLHIAANLIEIALGGQPAHWFYPPVEPERIAALVMFPLGEELGWRGFAYPRLVERHGVVIGCLILGFFWAIWHLGMMFTPDRYPDLVNLGFAVVELTAGCFVWAWIFERSGRSMAVAIALHMGAHLDNTNRAPESEVRLRILRVVVFVIAAVFAARALTAKPRETAAHA